MAEERFSIGELASAAATTPRTIRFYTTEGLLPPPLTEGRNAIYTEAHRRRLRLIQRLKAAYLPLSAIKEQMTGLTDAQVDGRLRNEAARTGSRHRLAACRPSARAAAGMSNVAYVAQVLAAAEHALAAPSGPNSPPPAKRMLIVSPTLQPYDDSDAVNNDDRPADLTASERWIRVHLLSGIELNVSEAIARTHRPELNRLIRFARTLFAEQGK